MTRQITLHAKNGIHTFDCRPGERILYAGLRQGLPLPYECGTGTCGTCRGRARDASSIDDLWPAASGGKRLRRDKGDFLMCQALAGQDCEIAVPSDIAPLAAGEPRPGSSRGRLVHPRRLTHDVLAFTIELDAPMAFEAGQFVVVEVAGVAGLRAYSMVNYAPGTRQLELVVKKKPGGGFSEWLFGSDRAGAEVAIFGPLGKAVFRPEEARDILCIAGGSGIAGMMSILAHGVGADYFARHRGDVYFGVRTLRDLFYADELAAFAAAAPGRLTITIALSDEDLPVSPPGGGHLRFDRGFVHEVAISGMTGRFDNVVAFVAGPAPMVDGALKALVTAARLPSKFIRYDKFS
jgi:toluene monooxygenase electron transfer component